jgi:hypothetical protein
LDVYVPLTAWYSCTVVFRCFPCPDRGVELFPCFPAILRISCRETSSIFLSSIEAVEVMKCSWTSLGRLWIMFRSGCMQSISILGNVARVENYIRLLLLVEIGISGRYCGENTDMCDNTQRLGRSQPSRVAVSRHYTKSGHC